MNSTSISARNWGWAAILSLYVVKWVYVGLGLGVGLFMARFPRDDDRRKQLLAKINREGEPIDSARICGVN